MICVPRGVARLQLEGIIRDQTSPTLPDITATCLQSIYVTYFLPHKWPWDHVLSDERYGDRAGWGFQEAFLRADRLSEESRAFTLCFPLLPTPEAGAMQEKERHLVTRGQAPAGIGTP